MVLDTREEGVDPSVEYSLRSQENHDEREGGFEDLGDYPSNHNPSIPLDLDHRSLGETGESERGAG